MGVQVKVTLLAPRMVPMPGVGDFMIAGVLSVYW